MEDRAMDRRLKTLEVNLGELQRQFADAIDAIVEDLGSGRTDPHHKECMHRLEDVAKRAKGMLKPGALPQRRVR